MSPQKKRLNISFPVGTHAKVNVHETLVWCSGYLVSVMLIIVHCK